MATEPAEAGKGGVLMRISVQPRAQQPGVRGIRNGVLVVRLKAAPEKGKANKELIATLAKFLGVAKADMDIVSGTASRQKRVLVKNLPLSHVTGKLVGLPTL